MDTSDLTGSGVRAEVVETISGNEPTGRFMLQADTAPRGWPEHRSGWIAIGASAREVEEAIVKISGIRAANVRVNASLPSVGPIAWEITFSHRQVVPAGESAVGVDYVATGQSGNRVPLRVVRPQLSGSGARVDAETIRDGDKAIGGLFEVYVRGDENTVVTIAAGASATSARVTLVQGLGLPEATDVIRTGPLDDNLAYVWTVTLPEGTTIFSSAGSDVGGELIVNASRLSGNGAFVEAALLHAGGAPLGGRFNVSFAGEEAWVPLPYNATSSEVVDAISSFATSGGNVSVSSEDVGDADSGESGTGRRWTVTFTALKAAGDVPAIEVNGTGMLTGASIKLFVNETSQGVTADIQELTIDGFNGTFTFYVDTGNSSTNASWNSSASGDVVSSSPVPWDATPSHIKTALFEATGKRVYVERSMVPSPTPGSGGYTWLVLFAEALGSTWGEVHINSTDLVPDDDLLAGEYRQANLTLAKNSTADVIGGRFSLKFGQICDERAAGVYCSVAETSQLRFDSSAGEVTAALEALPAILDATVVSSSGSAWEGVAAVAPDSFGIASAGTRFRVTLSRVVFNASDSVVAEYWHRTWSPDNSATEWSGDLATGGDLPLFGVDVTQMVGSHPTGRSGEATKGLSPKAGGVVAVEVSQNAGRDYTSSGITYVYEPLLSVDALVPDHGPIYGGTEVRQRFRPVCHI